MSVLLHVCCRNCLEIFDLKYRELCRDSRCTYTVFFYNPNIHPESEWLRRLKEVKQFCRANKLKFIGSDHDKSLWIRNVNPEKRMYLPQLERCPNCYDLRLKKLIEKAREIGAKVLYTTMLVSPYQSRKFIKLRLLELIDAVNSEKETLKLGDKQSRVFKEGVDNGSFLKNLSMELNNKLSKSAGLKVEQEQLRDNLLAKEEEDKKDRLSILEMPEEYEYRKLKGFYKQSYCGCVFSLTEKYFS